MRFKIKRLLWISPLAMALWILGAGIFIWQYGEKNHTSSADCAIVLGAAVNGSSPSPVFEERIRHAINLYRKGTVKKLVFTGGYGEGATHSESAVATSYASSLGIPKSDIFTEDKSRTTLQNLSESKKILDRHHLQSAIIVSDPIHMKRAIMMAEDLGILAYSSPTPTSRYRSFNTKLNFLSREVYFLHHYLIFRQ